MTEVTELGYVGVGVSDLAAWRQFAGEILGLEVVMDDDSGCCYLRNDYWHHRFVLYPDGSDDLAFLGLRVAGPVEFAAMQEQLRAAGIAFRVGAAAEAEERRVLEVMKLEDPDGNPIEIFHGPLVHYHRPFYPGRGMHGRFVTGSGGCGHSLIRQRDMEAGTRFYRALGMRGSVEYKLQLGEIRAEPVFMHCGTRDHAIAFGVGAPDRRLNHIMLEVDNHDDVGLTYDRVRDAGIDVPIDLGKHSNDHMFSFYMRSPSGFMIEYGFGARHATHQSEYYETDVFGHKFDEGSF